LKELALAARFFPSSPPSEPLASLPAAAKLPPHHALPIQVKVLRAQPFRSFFVAASDTNDRLDSQGAEPFSLQFYPEKYQPPTTFLCMIVHGAKRSIGVIPSPRWPISGRGTTSLFSSPPPTSPPPFSDSWPRWSAFSFGDFLRSSCPPPSTPPPQTAGSLINTALHRFRAFAPRLGIFPCFYSSLKTHFLPLSVSCSFASSVRNSSFFSTSSGPF